MNKLDEATIQRTRRRCVSVDDEFANHQRRIIFAAFGQRETDGRIVANHNEHAHPGEITLSSSLRSGRLRDGVLNFPNLSPARRRA